MGREGKKRMEGENSDSVLSQFRFLEIVGTHPYFQAVQRSLVFVLPLVMVGALGLCVLHFPAPKFHAFMEELLGQPWRMAFENAVRGTFGVASLAVLCSMAVSLAQIFNLRNREKGVSPAMAAAIAMSCFFVFLGPESVDAWERHFSLSYGLVASLFVAISSSAVFLWLSTKRLFRLRFMAMGHDPVTPDALGLMPAGVATIALFFVLRLFLDAIPLEQMKADASAAIIALVLKTEGGPLFWVLWSALKQALWFFGVHGPNFVAPLEEVLLDPAAYGAMDVAGHGLAPMSLYSRQFLDVFSLMGGSGCTLSLIIAVFLRSRTPGARKLSLVALPPALLNVNEPLLFGIPLVLNPVYLVPFILTPVVQTLVAYGAAVTGFVSVVAPEVHWTTPPFISGYIATGSWSGVALQAFTLALGVAIYSPFVALSDRVFKRQYKRVIGSLMDAACDTVPGADGKKCLTRPGAQGAMARMLSNDLFHALDNGDQIYVVYQPQVDTGRGAIVGVEALLRWQHPVYGHIPPPIVVALAEDTGTIDRLGMFVMETACSQFAAWSDPGGEDIGIAVNLSVRQLADKRLVEEIRTVLDDAGLAPHLLTVEITESEALVPNAATMDALYRLREMGVRVAIDDFGMGSTSLRYLREFPVDAVKLDRSLALEAPSGVDGHIVSSIMGLSEALGIKTVVEGVESRGQHDRFSQLGCTVFQGFLFSRPLIGEDCAIYLRTAIPPN